MALFSFSFSKFVKETVQRHKSWIQQETLFWKCYNTPVEEYFSKQIQIQTGLMSAWLHYSDDNDISASLDVKSIL